MNSPKIIWLQILLKALNVFQAMIPAMLVAYNNNLKNKINKLESKIVKKNYAKKVKEIKNSVEDTIKNEGSINIINKYLAKFKPKSK